MRLVRNPRTRHHGSFYACSRLRLFANTAVVPHPHPPQNTALAPPSRPPLAFVSYYLPGRLRICTAPLAAHRSRKTDGRRHNPSRPLPPPRLRPHPPHPPPSRGRAGAHLDKRPAGNVSARGRRLRRWHEVERAAPHLARASRAGSQCGPADGIVQASHANARAAPARSYTGAPTLSTACSFTLHARSRPDRADQSDADEARARTGPATALSTPSLRPRTWTAPPPPPPASAHAMRNSLGLWQSPRELRTLFMDFGRLRACHANARRLGDGQAPLPRTQPYRPSAQLLSQQRGKHAPDTLRAKPSAQPGLPLLLFSQSD
jgi:hypothetical protein